MDKLLFNVTFADSTHARLFAPKFTKYPSSIRRTTSSELASLKQETQLRDQNADHQERLGALVSRHFLGVIERLAVGEVGGDPVARKV